MTIDELKDNDEESNSINKFIKSLKELPLPVRNFAMKLSERMFRQDVSELPVEDVKSAFKIGHNKLKEYATVLQHHRIGGVGEARSGFGESFYICGRPGFSEANPFIEIIQFCDST